MPASRRRCGCTTRTGWSSTRCARSASTSAPPRPTSRFPGWSYAGADRRCRPSSWCPSGRPCSAARSGSRRTGAETRSTPTGCGLCSSPATARPDRATDLEVGAVVITGEALNKRNAEPIARMVADWSGRFVCISAGHNQEAVLAAHGSGAVAMSAGTGATVVNLDVGGGTTKFSVVRARHRDARRGGRRRCPAGRVRPGVPGGDPPGAGRPGRCSIDSASTSPSATDCPLRTVRDSTS